MQMIEEGEARRIYRKDPTWRPEKYEWKRRVRLSTRRSDEGKVDRCLAPEVAVDCLDVNGGELSGFGGSSRINIWSPPQIPRGRWSGKESPKPRIRSREQGQGFVSRLPGPHGPALPLPGHQGQNRDLTTVSEEGQ
jgi:hypothetical protein